MGDTGRATGGLWTNSHLGTTGGNTAEPIVYTDVAVLDMRASKNRRRCFLMGSILEYDMVVIGSGPGGQKAAIAAAKLGKSVAVIE